jgi:hypothetical protein
MPGTREEEERKKKEEEERKKQQDPKGPHDPNKPGQQPQY